MTTDDKSGNEVKKVEETKPVVWTPEDASRFLTSAIHEAQRPLAEALKQRPITSRALFLLVGIIVVAGLAIALILANQLEKAETRASAVQEKHDSVFAEKHELQAAHTTLTDRMSLVSDQHEELKGHVENLRKNEEVHKRTKTDLSKFRRHNEALRSQISGLEMEKSALARQLDALKKMMEEPAEDEDAEHPFDLGNAMDDHLTPELAAPQTTTPDENADAPEAPEAPVAPVAPVANDSGDDAAAAPEPAPISETSSIVTGRESANVAAPAAEPAPAASALRPPEPAAAPETPAEPAVEPVAEPEAEPVAEPEAPAEPEVPEVPEVPGAPETSEAPEAPEAPTESAEPEAAPDAPASGIADKAEEVVADTAARAAAALEKAEEALRSRTSALDASLRSPDKYQGITSQSADGQGTASADFAADADTENADGDHFRETSAAYGEQLSHDSEPAAAPAESADDSDVSGDAHAAEDASESAAPAEPAAEEVEPVIPESAPQFEGDAIDQIVIDEIAPDTDATTTTAENSDSESLTVDPTEETLLDAVEQVEEKLEEAAAQ